MAKSKEQLHQQLRNIEFRLRGILEEIDQKTKEGNRLYQRKIDLVNKIMELEDGQNT